MSYKMKDLGYVRTPTDAKLRVEMPDSSRWDIPVQIIADSRDEYYSSEEEDTIGFIRAGGLDNYKITDWAANNMNWDEVREYATQVPGNVKAVDFQEGWVNGEKEIVSVL